MSSVRALHWLGGLVAAAYLAFAVGVALAGGHWDGASASDEIVWYSLLVGGAVLLIAGLVLLVRSPWPAAALVSLGAFAGALAIFWALVPLPVAAILAVLTVRYARRQRALTA